MSKRPPIDLAALTSEAAAPMAEAVQRAAPRLVRAEPSPFSAPPPSTASAPAVPSPLVTAAGKPSRTPTADLLPLSFKVSPAFRKRFRKRAHDAELKLNELLFAALEAWEREQKIAR